MKIYLAGGWFTPEQEEEHTRIYNLIKDLADVFNPRIAGELNPGSTHRDMVQILTGNVLNINAADLIVAIYDGKDTGTIWETGYAYAKQKPIIFYKEKPTTNVNLMLAKTGDFIDNEEDLVKAILSKPVFKYNYDSYKGEIE